MPTGQGEPQRESQETAAEGGVRALAAGEGRVWTSSSGQSGDGAGFLESEGEERARSQMESWGGSGEGGAETEVSGARGSPNSQRSGEGPRASPRAPWMDCRAECRQASWSVWYLAAEGCLKLC